MTDLLKIAENLAAAGLDHPAVDDAVIKLTNAATHPARGVVDDAGHVGTLQAMFAVCANERRMMEADALDAAIQSLQAAAPPREAGEAGQGVAVIELTGVDEYGPMLAWHRHWVEFPIGTKFRVVTP